MNNEGKRYSMMIVEELRKLPLFKELTQDQVLNFLSVCSGRIFKTGKTVCSAGTDSTEMFLLLSGELSVSIESGVPIATLTPITTVGEMGIITEQPRTATVLVKKESELLVINKQQFEELVENDENLGKKIYKNIAISLCEKILNDNIRLRDYYEREKNFQEKMEALKNLLKTKAFMSDDEIEAEII